MQLYLRLAWRNLWRHRRRTLIIALSIALVMALMMFYDGMITGFEDAIYGNAIKVLGGNVQIHASGYHTQTSRNPLLPAPCPTGLPAVRVKFDARASFYFPARHSVISLPTF